MLWSSRKRLMESAFNYKTGKWQINWPQRISRHDVVYHSPPDDPMRGMPIGNGDIGALFWCEDSKLIIVLNKSDLWENKDVDPLICWSAEQEEILLRDWPERWQVYCNGFCHWGPLHVIEKEARLRFNTNTVEDASCSRIKTYADVGRISRGETLQLPSWPFRHMSMEPLAILACAMNESLLQSYDGIIAVAPAAVKRQNARFTLHAQNGFEVSSEIIKGRICWIFVKSLHGYECKIKNPWKKTYIYKNGKIIMTTGRKLLTINTKKNDKFIMVSDRSKITKWQTCGMRAEKNKTAKHYGQAATLGLPKMF